MNKFEEKNTKTRFLFSITEPQETRIIGTMYHAPSCSIVGIEIACHDEITACLTRAFLLLLNAK
jgi:hypothetical protein